MTVVRRDGGGTPFGEWVRRNKRLEAAQVGLSVTDIDYCFHKYRTDIDGMGPRIVRLMLDVEVKTFWREPEFSQLENLWIRHQQLDDKRRSYKDLLGSKVSVWSFGVSVLSLSGERPEDGRPMRWGRFRGTPEIQWEELPSVGVLEDLLSFRLRPDNPQQLLSLRRHHATTKVVQRLSSGLGFEFDEIVTRRS